MTEAVSKLAGYFCKIAWLDLEELEMNNWFRTIWRFVRVFNLIYS